MRGHAPTIKSMGKNKEESEVPRHRSRKNTKLWCKCKVGRLHEGVWMNYHEYEGCNSLIKWNDHSFVLICAKCMKYLDWCNARIKGKCRSSYHDHDVP